jgi:predicted CXXCH cytochrome family protein
MRKRILFLAAVIISVALFAGVGILIATDVPDEINIYSDAYEKANKKHRYGPTPFSHKKHITDYKIACTECHHVYKDGKNVFKEGDPVQKCQACHDPVKSKGNVKKLMLAFHTNCQGCHKDLKKAGKPTGPTTKCNDCHEKKK